MRTTRAAIAAAVVLFTVAACANDASDPMSPPTGAGSATGGSAAPGQAAQFVLEGEAGPVPNAVEFLASTETAWRDSLTGDANAATISDQARCYYQNVGTRSYRVVCGPIRRAGVDAAAVWDLLGTTIDTDSNRARRDYYSDKKSQPLPEGALTRPDGQAPPTPAEVAAPDTPVAPADLFAQVDPMVVKPVYPVAVDQSKSTLSTQWGTVTLTQSGKLNFVNGISAVIAGDVPDLKKVYAPADGHRLIVFTVDASRQAPSTSNGLNKGQPGDENTTIVFHAGDTQVDLSSVLGVDTQYGNGGFMFAASIPDGSTPTLTVNVDGQEQTLNIATATATG